MIYAKNSKPIEGNIRYEAVESIFFSLEITVEIEVFRVKIGDYRDGSRQTDKRSIGLICLNHHPLSVSKPCIRSIGIYDTAIYNGRIKSCTIKNCGDY